MTSIQAMVRADLEEREHTLLIFDCAADEHALCWAVLAWREAEK